MSNSAIYLIPTTLGGETISDIIPEEHMGRILNSWTIGDDTKYAVFVDNASNRIILPNFPLFE